MVGWLLKQIYLDELPQLINVLKGDLSIVGPRPLNLEVYNEQLKNKNYLRKAMKCGITGSFQSQKNMAGKNDYDLETKYARFCANNPGWKIVLLDLKIIARTILVIIKAEGI